MNNLFLFIIEFFSSESHTTIVSKTSTVYVILFNTNVNVNVAEKASWKPCPFYDRWSLHVEASTSIALQILWQVADATFARTYFNRYVQLCGCTDEANNILFSR